MLDDQTLTDIFFELLAFYQLFGADIPGSMPTMTAKKAVKRFVEMTHMNRFAHWSKRS